MTSGLRFCRSRRAGGHPLFIEEVARAVREGGGGDEVPASARDVVVARIDRLRDRAKMVLQHAAVLGPVFRTGIVEELSGPGLRSATMAVVSAEPRVLQSSTPWMPSVAAK